MPQNCSSQRGPTAPPSRPAPLRRELSSKNDTNSQERRTKRKRSLSRRYHMNSIWSLWYCFLTLGFTGYLVYSGVTKFLFYASLPWPGGEQPYVELNAHVGLVGASVVVMPFFIVASLLKVGNLPNDGFKLGSSLSTCSRDPPAVLKPTTGIVRNLWHHGVPTAPFLHLVAAFCLILPKTLMDASLIKAGFLPKADVWKTDLDVFLPFRELVVPPFLNSTDRLSHISLDDYFVRVPKSDQRNRRSFGNAEELSGRSQEPFAEYLKKNKSKTTLEDKLFHLPTYYPNPKPKTQTESPLGEVPKLPQERSWAPFSPEFLNYVIALLVFAVRYPSVFWHTNKKFSFVFSLYLVVTAIESVILLSAFSVFYKVLAADWSRESVDFAPFILNRISLLIMFILAVLTLTVSSSAIYFYGFQQFANFLIRSRKRFQITYENDPAVARPRTAKISALAILLCLLMSLGPITWDLRSVYEAVPDSLFSLALFSSIAYVVMWVFFWLFLCIKSSWVFKLRVTVARAFVSSARSIKLINDVEMANNEDSAHAPILVVGGGRAVAIKDLGPQRAIMGIVNKTKEEKRAKGKEDEIYWLRPNRSEGKVRCNPHRSKVTFKDFVDENKSVSKGDPSHLRRPEHEPLMDSDNEAGDYAILKSSSYHQVDSETSEGSDESHRLGDPRYVDRSQMLAYRRSKDTNSGGGSSDTSPVLVAPDYEETEELNEPDHSHQGITSRHQLFLESQGGSLTPRSTRSNDSGVPAETPSQRSDSISSSSSQTPQENSEESGVHPGNMENLRNKITSDHAVRSNSTENLTPLSPELAHQMMYRPSAFHGATPVVYCRKTSAESTVAIRRQRNLTQEIKPPTDPIYGTRKLSSFTESFPSGGLNSNSFECTDSPVPPMPLLSSVDGNNIISYSSRAMQCGRPSFVSPRINFLPLQESPYKQRFPQAPQIPLPPIPQGILIPSSHKENHHADVYGRTNGPQQRLYPSMIAPSIDVHRKLPVGRSSSLRYPSNSLVQKQYTNTLPHVLPKESNYNTNV